VSNGLLNLSPSTSDTSTPATSVLTVEYTSVTSPIIQLQGLTSQTSNSVLIFNGETTQKLKIVAYRFPTSSELVVTPERQNTWAGVVYTNQNQSLFAGTAEPTAQSPYTNATWNQPTLLKGKASVTTTNSGNDLGFSVANLPVGNYELKITGLLNSTHGASTVAGGLTICAFKLIETTTSTEVARQMHQDQQYGTGVTNETRNFVNSFSGVFNNTSVATRNFRLESQKFQDTTTGNVGNCQAFSAIVTNGNNTNITFLLTPLDQPSNSALYVQGPVLAAATGAAIPEGYVNEFSTRSISDTSSRQQSSPVLGTFYYPWTSTLTLPAGNWLLCYKALIEQEQTVSSSAVAYPRMHIQNQTDSSIVMTQSALGQITSAPFNINYIWSPVSQCKPIAITSSKTFRMGIAYGNSTGTASVLFLRLRGDVSETELYAIRLN
jgi:hypothetical protein